MNVHQVLSGAGPYDAVTTQAIAFRERFRAWGWGGRDVAAEIDPRIGDRIAPLRSLAARDGDVLLVHYSAYAPKLRAVLELPQRKLLISHNITPARWFWDHDPQAGVVCALGRKQLPQFAAAVDVAAGVSLYNAQEFGSDVVIPILFDPAGLGTPRPAAQPDPPGPPTILFVGRLAPHKRQDAVIRAFELYRRRHAPDARLVLVGAPINWPYDAAMRVLAEEISPGRVTIESGLTNEQLAGRWRSAHAFLCMSEHEGFCIPLLEAFHFGVPVIARAIGGVPEVAGDAALLLDDADDESVAAELLALAVGDARAARDAARARRRAGRGLRARADRAHAARRARVARLTPAGRGPTGWTRSLDLDADGDRAEPQPGGEHRRVERRVQRSRGGGGERRADVGGDESARRRADRDDRRVEREQLDARPARRAPTARAWSRS